MASASAPRAAGRPPAPHGESRKRHLRLRRPFVRMMNVHRNSDPSGELLQQFRALRENERFVDVMLITGDGGRRWAHSLVFVAGSEFLKQWMESAEAKGTQLFTLILPDFKLSELDLVLGILYGLETTAPADLVGRVHELADALGVTVDLPFLSSDGDAVRPVGGAGEEAPICCWHCNRPFSTLIELQVHVRDHQGERFKRKQHRCQFCKKLFPSMWRLRQHLVVHRRVSSATSAMVPTATAADHSYSGTPQAESDSSIGTSRSELMPVQAQRTSNSTISRSPLSRPNELQGDSQPTGSSKIDEETVMEVVRAAVPNPIPQRRASSPASRPEAAAAAARADHLYSARRLSKKEVARNELQSQLKKTDHLYSSQPSSPTGGSMTSSPMAAQPSLRKIRAKRQSVQAMGHSYAASPPNPPAKVPLGGKIRLRSVRSVRGQGGGAFGCNRCDLTFPQPYRLNRHVREVHMKERIHECRHDGCDKSFFKVTSRNRHELTHVTHEKWRCSKCQKCFRDQTALNYHTANNVCSNRTDHSANVTS